MPTKIEWTQETWNPITGCTPISSGCKNCYAKRMARRLAGRHGYPEAPHHFDVTFHPDRLEQPLHWKKPRSVFVCSMSDLFHKDVDEQWLLDIFGTMNEASWHVYQILTKRIERAKEFINYMEYHILGEAFMSAFPNVWLGVTAENQEQADKRIPILLQIPAAVRFVSVEPMLERVSLSYYLRSYSVTNERVSGTTTHTVPALDLAICGAETGPGARKMDLGWARSLRDQCQAADVPFFFKRDSDGNRKLDGRKWEETPE